MSDEKRVLTVPEAAVVLNGTERWVREQVRAGNIPHIRIGGRILILADSLEAMLRGESA